MDGLLLSVSEGEKLTVMAAEGGVIIDGGGAPRNATGNGGCFWVRGEGAVLVLRGVVVRRCAIGCPTQPDT